MKFAVLLFTGCIIAQLCMAQNPAWRDNAPRPNATTEYYKQQITQQVLKQLDKIDWDHVDRSTSGGTTLYTIPVVVHVLHNYGSEVTADSVIYDMIDKVNSFFLKTNPDTASIIDKFKPVAANTQIAFKLATVDPNGHQTKGVEHIFTYLTYINFQDQSKVNQWPQDRYLNIWTVYGPAVYSSGGFSEEYYTPLDASYKPYYDGIILDYGYDSYSNLISRLIARYLNLPYPCSCCGEPCMDGDGIADTPPCDDEYYSCANVYDTICDTPNVQNIMLNYDVCGIMFTYGQGQYMQNILQLDFGNRDSLVTPHNFLITGMGQPMPDMLPVSDFTTSVSSGTGILLPPAMFFCEGQMVRFKNESWNDTIVSAYWTFSNNANIAYSSSLTTVQNKFHQPGWAAVSLTVTGNNTGTATRFIPQYIFIADSVATNAAGYVQEFIPGSGMDKWPIFNYYHNDFTWQVAGTGYYDNSSLEYNSYDFRTNPQNFTGTPQGDIDDVFTPAFDLTAFADSCYLNFMSSGASRTSAPHSMTDSFEIDYSVDENQTWTKLIVLKGNELDNKGKVTVPYAPESAGDWVPHAISLPAAARTAYTLFRLRYHPGADTAGFSSGNNFYLDHFNFSGFPESVQVIDRLANGVFVMPNPTNGDAYVIIKDQALISNATVFVTDITGNVIYETSADNNSDNIRLTIPRKVFRSKGLYLVHVTTDGINQTQKLVVY